MTPDENSPTLPNEPAVRPPQRTSGASPWMDDALPMAPPPNAPPATNDGRPPAWSIPTPPKPPGANNRAFGIGLAVGLIVLAAMALGILIVLAFSGNNPTTVVISPTATATLHPNPQTPTATPLPPVTTDEATTVVTSFFTDINSQQYQIAYNLFSSQQQSAVSLSQFQQQWQGILEVTPDPSSINAAQDSSDANISVSLTYSQVDASAQTQFYQATVVVGYDQAQVRILSFTTQQLQATPSPTSTPSTTPTTSPPPLTSPTPTDTPTDTPTGSPTGGPTP